MTREKMKFDMDSFMSGKPGKPDLSDKLSKPGLSSKLSKPEYRRATYIVKEEYIEKIKSLAYWERREITQVINEALEQYLKDKKIKMIPGKSGDLR